MRTLVALPLAGLVTLTLALGSARPAFASDGTKPDDVLEKSSALYKKARGLQEHGQWAEAEKLYQEAWDLRPTFDIAGNLGDCELHVGQPREAEEHLAYALKNLPAGWTPEQKAALTTRLQEARGKRVPLKVDSAVEDLEILVNGHVVSVSAEEHAIYVEPGDTVEGRHAGYTPDKQVVDAAAIASKHLTLRLDRIARSKVPSYAIGGAGLAAMVVGFSFIGVAESKRSEAKALSLETKHACPVSDPMPVGKCKDLTSAASSGDTFGNVGIAAVAVGATAAAGAVAYWFLSAPRDETPPGPTMKVVPTASTTGGGVFVVGTF
jgi:hypothetical protein